MPAGRPSEYTQEIAARICSGIADGKSLKSICEPEDMPCKATVYLWLQQKPEFLDLYVRAREDQADTLADEIIDIADDSKHDIMIVTNADGTEREVENREVVNRSRLRVDARKWVASKLKPKKYGDAMIHKGDETAPISVKINLG